MAINTAIGGVAFLVLFRGQDEIALWGATGLVIDCLLQGFMVGVMSVLPPGVLTRVRIAKGNVPGMIEPIGALLKRALHYGIASMVCLIAIATVLATLSGATTIGFVPGFILKALASVVAVSIMTPPATRGALGGVAA